MSDKLRLFHDDNGWGVLDDTEPRSEINNYGLLAYGFPDEASAREWLADYRLEQQSSEWEEHAYRDEPLDPLPF